MNQKIFLQLTSTPVIFPAKKKNGFLSKMMSGFVDFVIIGLKLWNALFCGQTPQLII